MPGTVEVESTFLARLNFIWKGFINMPSVAKFVTKAYPVSGSAEYLTEVSELFRPFLPFLTYAFLRAVGKETTCNKIIKILDSHNDMLFSFIIKIFIGNDT